MAAPAWKTAADLTEGFLSLNSVMLKKFEAHELVALQAELEKAAREARSTIVPQDDADASQKKNRKLLRISQALTVIQAFRIRGR
ncbi:MAG: hypothetical protein IPP07_04865 [Holophagales bacterium]|jgi:hypothetical protein|nr:hypothetical protein [Holophagales bacterium]MBK9964257.1 hypothetical protein [Holophagales bacterium]